MRKVDPAKFEARRRDILAASARCFRADGLRGASISKICAEAGISPGHLYHYFTDKEQIVEQMAAQYLASVEATMNATKGDDVERFVQVELERESDIDGIGDCLLLLDFISEGTRNPAIARILNDSTVTVRMMLATLIQRGQCVGTIRAELEPLTTASTIIAVLDGALVAPVRDPEINVADLRRSIMMMLHHFLSPTIAGDTRQDACAAKLSEETRATV